MTVSADARTNSLIVAAPEPLFQEVKKFVEDFDQAGTDVDEVTTVISLKKANPEVVQRALAPIVGPQVKVTNVAAGQTTPQATSGAPAGQASPAARNPAATAGRGQQGTRGGQGGQTGGGGDFEQSNDARIGSLVQWMAVAWDHALRGAILPHYLLRRLVERSAGGTRDNLVQQLPGLVRRAENHRAAAQDSSGDSALQRFRRGGQRQAARLHARYQAVLCDRDQRRIQHAPLRFVRQAAGDEQPDVIGETDLADELGAQVATAHQDRVFVRGRDRGAAVCLRADLHGSNFSHSEICFAMRTWSRGLRQGVKRARTTYSFFG